MPDLSDPTRHNWRQGVVVPQMLPELDVGALGFVPPLRDRDRLVLISHDCDICHGSLEEEPEVEVVAARSVAPENDGSYFHAKNPRRLRFRATDRGEDLTFEATMTDRRRIPRRLLWDCAGCAWPLMPAAETVTVPAVLTRRPAMANPGCDAAAAAG